MAASSQSPFWKTKTLDAMNDQEWESLCDGCGRCCLVKLEDEDTGDYYATDLVCRLFDETTCRCRDYPNRQKHVDDCVRLTPDVVRGIGWLPPTCAYRLVAEGKDLAWWHPLVSGDPETVVQAGISVKGRIHAVETAMPFTDFVTRIKKWPFQWPAKARRASS